MALKMLVLYYLPHGKARKTVDDHLYSFLRYTKRVDYFYFNVIFGVPKYLAWLKYDAVLLHYTLFARRYAPLEYPAFFRSLENLKNIPAPKVGIPQDEYNHTDDICNLIKYFNVETVFTCASQKDFRILYPRSRIHIRHHFRVFPGYVDDLTLERIRQVRTPDGHRSIDIGYRGRKLPFWTGRYAQNKFEIGEVVKAYCRDHTHLIVDIQSGERDAFFGDEWLTFLGRCKAVLGCESGATLMDRDGSIRVCVGTYLAHHPGATFDEVESTCFPRKESNIGLLTISPRHFEAAMTKTCQILLEGKYLGLLKPDIHYIPLKADYSNIAQVIDKFQDEKYRQHIVDNCYRDLVLSGKYTYRVFANQVIHHIRTLSRKRRKQTTFVGTSIFVGGKLLLFILEIVVVLLSRLSTSTSLVKSRLRKFRNRMLFRLIILPGSTIKQGLIRRKLWPFLHQSSKRHR